MVKHLINKLGKVLKRAFCLATTVFSLYSCSLPASSFANPEIKSPQVPKSVLYADPLSGKAPLGVHLKLNGEDPDNDIKEYTLSIDRDNDGIIDETITQQNPIEITRNYDAGIVKVYGKCTDSEGLKDEKNLELTVTDPVLDFSGINKTLNEEAQKQITLPLTIDGYPIIYTGITSYSDKLKTSELIGNILRLEGKKDATGDYVVNLKFEFNGRENPANLEGVINNLPDVSGSLESNEDDAGKSGVIRAFGVSDSNYIPLSIKDNNDCAIKSEISTNSSGNFDFQIMTDPDQPFTQFVLQGAIKDGGVWTSYIRTIKNISKTENYSAKKIRAVPYPDFCSKEDFRVHIGETNIGIVPEQGLMKWDLDELQGIEILKYDPLDVDDSFENVQQTFIQNKILDPTDIGGFVEGRILNVQIDTEGNQDSQKHYYIIGENPFRHVLPDPGWIIVTPDSDFNGGQAWVHDSNFDREIDRGKIKLEPESVTDIIVSHEFGHVLIAETHAITLPSSVTIMIGAGGSPLTRPGVADVKASHLVYEDTYPPKEKRDDILGMNWIGE